MRTHRLVLFALLFGLLGQEATAQKIFQRKRPEIIPLDGSVKLNGFFVGPGVTYTLTRFSPQDKEMFQVADTTYNATFEPEGRFGLYLEAGWYKVFRYSKIVDYMDIGLAFKQLRGAEQFNGLLTYADGDSLLPLAGGGDFHDDFLSLNVNFNNTLQLGDRTFLQNSLGLNGDYRISSSWGYAGDFGLNNNNIPGDLRIQAHYRIGFGWKMTRSIIMIPTLETPVLDIVEWADGRSDFTFFNSRYRPIIFSVRFLFLRTGRKGFDCPPVKTTQPPKKDKQYKPDSYHP